MKKNYLLIAFVTISMLFSSCGNSKKKNASEKKEVTIALVNWIECIANTHLAKVALESKGYKVNLINADVAPVFAAIANGDADVFMETWEPITHKPYLDKFGSKIEHLGTVFNDGRLGLVVPEYVDINSIEELNSVKDKFEKKIIGISPGAGLMKMANSVIEEYGLDFELVASSEAGMLAALKKAYDKNEWVVVTGWKPHTKFARFKLKTLEDPKGLLGQAETLSTVATKGWSEKNPELATFFSNFTMTEENMGTLMVAIENSAGKEDEAALEWYNSHKELVDSWFKK